MLLKEKSCLFPYFCCLGYRACGLAGSGASTSSGCLGLAFTRSELKTNTLPHTSKQRHSNSLHNLSIMSKCVLGVLSVKLQIN